MPDFEYDIRDAIRHDSPDDLKRIYRNGAGAKTTVYEQSQLAYACKNCATACAYLLLNEYCVKVTKGSLDYAIENSNKMPHDLISTMIYKSNDRGSFLQFAIEECYANHKYSLLLHLVECFDFGFSCMQLKVLGFLKHQDELIKQGAVYDIYDVCHAAIYYGAKKKIIDYFAQKDFWNFKDHSGNIIHVLKSLLEGYKLYKTGVKYQHNFDDVIDSLFNRYPISPVEIGKCMKPACFYLEYYLGTHKTWLKMIENYGANCEAFRYTLIMQNKDLRLLFECGLDVNSTIKGCSMFEFALKHNKFHSLSSLYGKVQDFRSFIGEKHIIELAFNSKQDYAVGSLFEKSLGYCPEDYYQIRNFKLYDAFVESAYWKMEYINPRNYGILAYDVIKHFEPSESGKSAISKAFDYFVENSVNLELYDMQFKYFDTYFDNGHIPNNLSVSVLIKIGASLKYGNPLSKFYANKDNMKKPKALLDEIIYQGLAIQKVDADCGLIDDILMYMNEDFGIDIIKALEFCKTKCNTFNIKKYDDKVKFLQRWENNEKIKSNKNYIFLLSIGASAHHIENIPMILLTHQQYSTHMIKGVLKSYITKGKKFPALPKSENYLLLALKSESMVCKTPEIIQYLAQLIPNLKSVENEIIFTMIDRFLLSVDFYQAVIDSGINIDVKTKFGETPLIYLLKNWGICEYRYTIAEFFLKNGISKTYKDDKGYTALTVAKIEKDQKMIELLK